MEIIVRVVMTRLRHVCMNILIDRLEELFVPPIDWNVGNAERRVVIRHIDGVES
jgi:hypothetical protein